MTGIVASKAPSLLVGIVAVLILASEIEPRKLDTPKIHLAKTPKPETQLAAPKPPATAVPIARLQLPPAPVRAAAPPPPRSEPKPAARHVVPMPAKTPPPAPPPKAAEPETRAITPMKPAEPQVTPSPPADQPKRLVITALKPAKPRPTPRPVKTLKREVAPATDKAVEVQRDVAAIPPQNQAGRNREQAVDGSENRATGRALLRMLEHGKGPTIEIAWPKTRAGRQRLYRRFTRCYGMRAAVLDSGNKLFDRDSTPGVSWNIDRDRFSGFLRSPAGESIRQEGRQFAEIAARHGLSAWRPVRVFPRNVDAVLLGGLEAVLDKRYQSSGKIRGTYELVGPNLLLTAITVDGRRVDGRVDLTGVAARACRVAAG